MEVLNEHRWHLQVNHTFRDAILASPVIRHKIDLFAVGLEYNEASGVSLNDSQKALLQYRTSLGTLRPIEEKTVNSMPWWNGNCAEAAGGVYSIIEGGSVRLFTLGSASRGITHKEWRIPVPVAYVSGYCFYPGADVIAFVEHEGLPYVRWLHGFRHELISVR